VTLILLNRDEIHRLKGILGKVSANCIAGKCQEEATRTSDENYCRLLEEKNGELKNAQKLHEQKYGQLQEIVDLVSKSKVRALNPLDL